MKLQNKTRHQQTKEPKCDNVHHFSFQHVSMLTSVTYLCLFRYLVRKQTFWTNVMFQQMKRKYLQILHFSIQAAQLPGSRGFTQNQDSSSGDLEFNGKTSDISVWTKKQQSDITTELYHGKKISSNLHVQLLQRSLQSCVETSSGRSLVLCFGSRKTPIIMWIHS